MAIDLAHILREETSIFKYFGAFREFSKDVIAFASDSEEVPHWNTVYCLDLNPESVVPYEEEIERFYSENAVKGHLMRFDKAAEAIAAETSEYFFLEQSGDLRDQDPFIRSVSVPDETELSVFCQIMAEAFQFTPETAEFFQSKMKILARSTESHFYICSYEGSPCGTASTFRTKGGADFLFNVSVLPRFQNLALGTAIVHRVARASSGPVYTYSHNEGMRKKILPMAGFSTAGTIHIVPFDQKDTIGS